MQRSRSAHAGHTSFLPAMGHGHSWLLPLYDPLTRLAGVPAAHRRLVELAEIDPGARVLDVGTGTGNLAIAVKRAVPRATVTGLDPDGAALDRARRKARRTDLDIRFERGAAGELPWPDGSVDRIVTALVYHHLSQAEKRRFLAEARRVLTPGGMLCLYDFERHAREHRGHGPRGAALLADNSRERVRAFLGEAGLVVTAETSIPLRVGKGGICYLARVADVTG